MHSSLLKLCYYFMYCATTIMIMIAMIWLVSLYYELLKIYGFLVMITLIEVVLTIFILNYFCPPLKYGSYYLSVIKRLEIQIIIRSLWNLIYINVCICFLTNDIEVVSFRFGLILGVAIHIRVICIAMQMKNGNDVFKLVQWLSVLVI